MAKKRINPFEDPFINNSVTKMDDYIDLPAISGLNIADLTPRHTQT